MIDKGTGTVPIGTVPNFCVWWWRNNNEGLRDSPKRDSPWFFLGFDDENCPTEGACPLKP